MTSQGHQNATKHVFISERSFSLDMEEAGVPPGRREQEEVG